MKKRMKCINKTGTMDKKRMWRGRRWKKEKICAPTEEEGEKMRMKKRE